MRKRTEVVPRVAPALALLVRGALRTVLEGIVAVPDVAEEVDLADVRKERGADAVDGGVAPALVWVSETGKKYGLGDIPRSKIRPLIQDSRNTQSTLRLSRTPYPRSQSCSRLYITRLAHKLRIY